MSVSVGPSKHAPEHWEREFGFHVTNPYGWMKRGIEFDRPITADSFVVMGMDSLIQIDNYQKMVDTGAIELPWLQEKENIDE